MDNKWQKLQASIPWDVLRDTQHVVSNIAPANVAPMSRQAMTPRQLATVGVGILIASVVLTWATAYTLGSLSAHPAPVTIPALSSGATVTIATPALPSIPVNAAAPGPLRQRAPMPTADPRARTHWLLMCHVAMQWYETRAMAERAQQSVCGGGGIIHEPLK